jgi:hypothetical protein
MYQPVEQPKSKFCSQCGNLLRVEAKFCARCGTAVAKPATPMPPPPPQQAGTSDPTILFPSGQQPYTPPPPPLKAQSPFYQQQPQAIPFTHAPSRVNLSVALRYPFESSNWLFIMLIGGFLILIPLIGLIVVNGYIVEIIRRVANDDYDVLPGWDDFGAKIKDGTVMLALLIIWAFLPMLLFSAPGYLLSYAGQDAAVLTTIGALLGTFVTYFFLPLVWGRYAVTNQFMAGLQVAQIWAQVRVNFARYIGNWLLAGLMLFLGVTVITIFASISIALMVIILGICIMPFALVAGFYTTLIQAHLMGQLYRIMM